VFNANKRKKMERAIGIEPISPEWNSKALPTTTRIN